MRTRPWIATLELAGEHLLYSVALKRTGVFLSAAPLDGAGVLEFLVRFNDTAEDWATLQRLVRALEVNAIRSLHPRPLEVGYGARPRQLGYCVSRLPLWRAHNQKAVAAATARVGTLLGTNPARKRSLRRGVRNARWLLPLLPSYLFNRRLKFRGGGFAVLMS